MTPTTQPSAPTSTATLQHLIDELRHGCYCKPRRWSGDNNYDTGRIDDIKTDRIMNEAADVIFELMRDKKGTP